MSFAVVFAPEAQDSLVELYTYIAERASPAVAKRYTDAIVESCERLANLPHQGTRRDDVRPGLRITNHRRRTVIAFDVDDDKALVSILGIFYGGRNYESTLGVTDWTDDASNDP
jgi:toxin ParE1/3/4